MRHLIAADNGLGLNGLTADVPQASFTRCFLSAARRQLVIGSSAAARMVIFALRRSALRAKFTAERRHDTAEAVTLAMTMRRFARYRARHENPPCRGMRATPLPSGISLILASNISFF